MKLKPSNLEIPVDNPFRNDVLERKPLIESLSTLVAGVAPPFVLCVDAPWGTGKTTFLNLWKAHLSGTDIQVLYFNAWTTDFAPDPLVAFVGEITELINKSDTQPDSKKHVERLRQLGSKIAKRAFPVAVKVATAGLLDAEDLIEESVSSLAEDLAGDAIQAYEREKKLIDQFRTALEGLIGKLSTEGKEPRLLVLVDELDRCRPSYALELLERIKHLFNVANVVFVLALDKRQLRSSVEALYGIRIDSEDYLRRFIDLEVSLPLPSKPETFTDYLFGQFEFSEAFKGRKHPAFQYDAHHLKSNFNALSNVFQLTLRTREQCFTRMRVALLSTPDENHIYPDLLVLLVILRAAARDVYTQFVSGEGSVTDVLECIRRQPTGARFLRSREGALLETFLIAAVQSRSRGESVSELDSYQQAAKIDSPKDYEEEQLKERAQLILDFLEEMRRFGRSPGLQYLASKVELAPQERLISQ